MFGVFLNPADPAISGGPSEPAPSTPVIKVGFDSGAGIRPPARSR
jgi:hypothetical protein